MELDSRLLGKSEFEKMKQQPAQTFRSLLATLIPSLDIAASSDQQLQCMLKAPFTFRTQLLEISGQAALLTRDFIDHANEPDDTTILPRFWNVSANDLNDMRIVTKGITGAAGLVVTRRGIALRIWAKRIAAARKALMPSDPRLNRRQSPRGASHHFPCLWVALGNRSVVPGQVVARGYRHCSRTHAYIQSSRCAHLGHDGRDHAIHHTVYSRCQWKHP